MSYNPTKDFLATGSEDKLVKIWDARSFSKPLVRIDDHTAATKALCWSPWKVDELISGGGTNCAKLYIHDVSGTPKITSGVATPAQVTNIFCLKESDEIVLTQGYSTNAISIIDRKTLIEKASLSGHTKRPNYAAQGPTETFIATAAADKKLCIWDLATKKKEHKELRGHFNQLTIR